MEEDKQRQAADASGGDEPKQRVEIDIVSFGIVCVAILLFVALGAIVVPQLARNMLGTAHVPDLWLISGLIINIALILFSWRRYIRLQREMTYLRQSEEQARKLAVTDALTGFLNRRGYMPMAEALIARAATKGKISVLLLADLDDLKTINDRYGRNVGDKVLQETAQRIDKLLPPRTQSGRVSSDEFAYMLSMDVANIDHLDELAMAISVAVRKPIVTDMVTIKPTVTIGLVHSGLTSINGETKASGENNAEAMLHMAEVALLHAKSLGRNSYVWFEPALESELRFRKELEARITKGIENGEFVPYYEQQIDLHTGELVGFEMLARWNSPIASERNPEFFIPIAERMGVISELSELVISQALHDARAWDPQLTLAVNVSPLQLRDPWFAQKLLKLLVEANFPPHRLEIEITESFIHENIDLVAALVTSVKNQGVRTSLDDFGSGYSSIAQLRTLPFDRIKIDRSIVSNLPKSKENASILQAIVKLSEGLDIPITAEGVESKAIAEMLKGFGVFRGQGYYYGHPQPADVTHKQLEAMGLIVGSVVEEPALPVMNSEDVQA